MAFLPYRGPSGKEWPIHSRRETHRFELIMQINRVLTFASRLDVCVQGRASVHEVILSVLYAENDKNIRWEN